MPNDEQRRLGETIISTPYPAHINSPDDARLHRELAIGNFFVELRGLVSLGRDLAGWGATVLQEIHQQAMRERRQ